MIEQLLTERVSFSGRGFAAFARCGAAIGAAALLGMAACAEADAEGDSTPAAQAQATPSAQHQGHDHGHDGHEGHDHEGHDHSSPKSAEPTGPHADIEVELPLDFGTVQANETIKKSLLLVNRGDETVTFSRVTTSCSCVTGEVEVREIQPGDSAEMVATLKVPGTNGDLKKTLYVFRQGERRPLQIPVHAVIEGGAEPPQRTNAARAPGQAPTKLDVELEPQAADLGHLLPEETKEMTVAVKNTGKSPIRFTRVSTNCSCASGEISDEEVAPGESAKLTVRMEAGPNPGPLNRKLYVWAAGKSRPVEVPVNAEVSYPVKAEPFFLNLLKQDKSGTIELTALDGRPFRVLSFNGSAPMGAEGDDPSSPAPEHAIRWDMNDLSSEEMPKFALLETDHPKMPLLDFRVIHPVHFQDMGGARDAWTLSHDRLLLGEMSPGDSIARTIKLVEHMNEEIESVSSKNGLFDIEVLDKSMKPRGLSVRIRITPSDKAASGDGRVLMDEIMFKTSDHESGAMVFAKLTGG